MTGLKIPPRLAIAVVIVLAAAAVPVLGAFRKSSGGGRAVTIGGAMSARPVPSGFIGLSMEFRGLEAYVGQDPQALDPAFVQLIRDVSPNQPTVLRIGGDSTDWTWWPVAGVRQPPGVKYSLTPNWMSVAHAFASALRARLILGVNLEADNRTLAAGEASAMVSRIGRGSIEALEIGNEPELYAGFGWYKSAAGRQVPGRPPGYNEIDFFHDYSNFSSAMPAVSLAGPSSGSRQWLAGLGSFLRTEHRVHLATVHAYPLKHCVKATNVTMGELLSDQASHGLAVGVTPYVAVAHQHGVPLRVDEINAVSCGGQRGVSNAFGSALWALDTMFELARIGVAGVNIQTVPNTINEVLGATQTGTTWEVRVHPEFYGLMMFAQAAPPGSRLLTVSGAIPPGVKVWATRAPNGHIHVVVINKHLGIPETVQLRIGSASGAAAIEQLHAPSAGAQSGVTLGGQTFGVQTSTGVLVGTAQTTTVSPISGAYSVPVPAASATMLTIPAR